MPLSNTELNRLADNIVANELRCYIHSGNPGSSGTSNRITPSTGDAYRTLAASDWSSASNGDVEYEEDVEYGVLDTSNNQTVQYWSIFRVNAFVASGTISPNITVTAGGTFKINTDTIDLNGSTT